MVVLRSFEGLFMEKPKPVIILKIILNLSISLCWLRTLSQIAQHPGQAQRKQAGGGRLTSKKSLRDVVWCLCLVHCRMLNPQD